jgi:hypothetical protein
MLAVNRHYRRVGAAVADESDFEPGKPNPPLVVVPIESWNRVADLGLRSP